MRRKFNKKSNKKKKKIPIKNGKILIMRYYNRGDETKRNRNFGLFKKNMARCFYV